ncbi:MAG TPA: glycosyltransferase family 4 protein, partial [Verrucomicrobiae bacterium]|nr:glycosyltransferase family 4 protein [Verrucomicrobiae bacterium]
TVIAPGGLSLRKGTPYLLESFRLVLKKFPTARLVLSRDIFNNVAPVFAQYTDLPIDWDPWLPHPQLAERMRACDILVLPSLEDGFARTVTEGLACGLPVITTPNTGASDLIIPGKNGEIVPIRDPAAIAEAVFKWADIILSRDGKPEISFDANSLSFEAFEKTFIEQLKTRGLA